MIKRSRKMEPIQNNKSNRSTGTKVWPLSDSLEQNKKQERIMGLLQEFTQVEPMRGTLVQSRGRNTRRDDGGDENESFHRAIGVILAVAQVFGLFPLSGIRNSTPARLSYSFFSFHVLYALMITAMLTFMSVLAVIHMIKTLKADTLGKHGGIAAATAGAMFYTNSLFGTLLFLWLAPRWINLQREWRIMERQLNGCKHPRPKLRWKFAMITTVVMIPALIEHILSVLNNVSSRHLPNNGINATWKDYVESYSIKSHAFILSSVNYSLGLGIFLFIISKIATFTWNFTDLFIMLVIHLWSWVSTGLAERYKWLNQVVFTSISSDHRSFDWRIVRERYATLSSLVKRTDNDISPIILLSFANNLYFICLQLLNGLSFEGFGNICGFIGFSDLQLVSNESPPDGILMSVYFFGSFAFLVGRTVGVTLLAARINDQSRLALPAIYNCPASTFTVETQRLQYQLACDEVNLTGLKFFSITRNFMLAVAGAIVTYEVVLLQFNVAMNK